FALVYFIFQRKKLRQASIQQAQLNQELKETLKFKNKLIAIVAHDIRNPMNGITGITELFANGSVKPHEVPAFMTKLDASSRSVNLLLENLLNWVKSQSDGFSLNLSEVSLHSLIKDVQLETNTQLNEKGIALKVDLSQAPERVKTDVNMLELVVRNVLTNSIKYSESNTAISVSYEEQIGYHALKIADNGVGMSKETIAELLNSNNRKSTQGTKSEKGTGLGIGLCQDMMGVLGGDLEIESELGKGTTVTIKFPKSKSVAVR
ncbi:MAG: HAMP domain-containing histidine kinase, partial [Bacteroidetes bacterium]|nr:HAMP domain-containing histidine kinase [Bacteroidota bacterium]